MIKCEKIFPSIYKHKECNASIILRYTKMLYPPKITNEKKSDHNFLYPSDTQHKNVPEKIVNPLVNAFSMGDIPHILLLVSDFQAIEEAIP